MKPKIHKLKFINKIEVSKPIFKIKTLLFIVTLAVCQHSEAQNFPSKKLIKKAKSSIKKVTTIEKAEDMTTVDTQSNTSIENGNSANTVSTEVLDAMIAEVKEFNTVTEKFGEACSELEQAKGQSLNGTAEDQILALNKIVSVFQKFETEDQPLAEQILSEFSEKYKDDYGFMDVYKEAYKVVEDNIEKISNNEDRRTATSELNNAYKYMGKPQFSYLESSVSKLQEYKDSMIRNVVNSASAIASTISYQKTGKKIYDRLNGATSSLKLVQKLSPDNQDIKDKLEELKVIGENQITKLKEAWAANRFPKRYSGGSAPANAQELEKMGIAMFKKNNPNRKAYKAVIADGWVTVYNIYGAPIYNQIDIFIAVEDVSNSKIANINYFTFKTDGSNSKSVFARYSVANLRDMYVANLNK